VLTNVLSLGAAEQQWNQSNSRFVLGDLERRKHFANSNWIHQ